MNTSTTQHRKSREHKLFSHRSASPRNAVHRKTTNHQTMPTHSNHGDTQTHTPTHIACLVSVTRAPKCDDKCAQFARTVLWVCLCVSAPSNGPNTQLSIKLVADYAATRRRPHNVNLHFAEVGAHIWRLHTLAYTYPHIQTINGDLSEWLAAARALYNGRPQNIHMLPLPVHIYQIIHHGALLTLGP